MFRKRSDTLVVFDDRNEVIGDDGLSFSLSLHVAARSTACNSCFLDTFRIIANECGVDDVLARSATEFACVLFQIERHESK